MTANEIREAIARSRQDDPPASARNEADVAFQCGRDAGIREATEYWQLRMLSVNKFDLDPVEIEMKEALGRE